MSSYIPYPNIEDDNFYEKIFYKKEFYDTKPNPLPMPDDQSEETISELFSTKGNFRLQSGQQFLKNFISPTTPYNGILVYHGTGVGKTCTAISIAEGFSERNEYYGKNTLIISSPSIKNEFIKTIFNFDKYLKAKSKQIVQCTGTTYKIKDDTYLSIKQKQKTIEKMIMNKYEFSGRVEIKNKILRNSGWNGKKEDLKEEHIDYIKKYRKKDIPEINKDLYEHFLHEYQRE